MSYWFYRGRITTPINHPEKGPIILTPRMVFDAPKSAVQNLLNKKMVVPAKPHQIRKMERAKKAADEAVAKAEAVQKAKVDPPPKPAAPARGAETETPKPQEAAVVEPKTPHEAPAVVASGESESVSHEEAKPAVEEPPTEKKEQEEGDSSSEEKETPKRAKRDRGRRRKSDDE